MGKTFCGRCLALYAALDPYVKLHVFDRDGQAGLAEVRAGR